jgi:hypothetical protein
VDDEDGTTSKEHPIQNTEQQYSARASICWCMIHIIIFSILVFATTPSAMYDAFRDWSGKDWSGIHASLFLTTINLLIPVLVNLPDYLCSCCIPYEMKSSTHLWKFQRNLLYMTVTSVIMPMVGINSVVNMMHGKTNNYVKCCAISYFFKGKK